MPVVLPSLRMPLGRIGKRIHNGLGNGAIYTDLRVRKGFSNRPTLEQKSTHLQFRDDSPLIFADSSMWHAAAGWKAV